MRFYNGQHRHYCGVDLHTKRMYLCILDHEGNKLLHRNVRAKPHDFLSAIEGFRDDLVVGAECMFTWYWLADLCLDLEHAVRGNRDRDCHRGQSILDATGSLRLGGAPRSRRSTGRSWRLARKPGWTRPRFGSSRP